MLSPVRTDVSSVARSDSERGGSRLTPDLLALAAVIVLGALVRFVTIAHQSYWVDEATTVHEIRLSLGGLFHQLHVNESTPPLYYVLAWAWSRVFGSGEVGLRSLSALAGTALIPVAYGAARELVSRWAGVLAAALVAVSPFMIWYSQEARAYMLFALFGGLSFLFTARLRTRPGSRRDLALWAVCSALAIVTHFFAGFLVAPEALALLWWRRERATVAAVGAVALVQAAMVPIILGDTNHPLLAWIRAFPLSVRLRQVPTELALSSLYKSPVLQYGLIGAAVLAALMVALVWLGGRPGGRDGIALAACVAAFALLVPVVLELFGLHYVVPRNFIAAWVPLAVVLAGACLAPRTLPAGAALAAVVLCAFVYSDALVYSRYQYQRSNWRAVAQMLGPARTTRAIVADDAGFAGGPLSLYLPHAPWPPSPGPVRIDELDVVGFDYQTPAKRLPAGVRLLSRGTRDGFTVARFAVPGWRRAPAQLAAQAGALLPPAPPASDVLVQRPR